MQGNQDQALTRVEFAQSEPLTTRLHGLIRSYPRGVGLIQEFVQNADDAGATTVRIWLDERTHPSSSLPAPRMSSLQGPAIVVTNDACFTDHDWKRLQTIGQSGKCLDSSKTGRFGLGFNSVYNVTDFPCILSGDTIGIFDPHGTTVADATPQKPGGAAWRLDDALWQRAGDMLAPFHTYGLATGTGNFDGTAFRLPLRTDEQAQMSAICSSPFANADFDTIINKLTDRVGELLLFLNHVTKIEIGAVSQAGRSRVVLSAETLNEEEVTAARLNIHGVLEQPHADVLASLRADGESRHATFNHELQVNVGESQSRETWVVTRGLFADPDAHLLDCAEEMFAIEEKAVPLAGAASLVESSAAKTVTGRVYCGLPLPPNSPVAQCHIDGFFDLQADRQGLFQDPEAEGVSATRVRWNQALVEHGCGRALALHCEHLAKLAVRKGHSPYAAWPRVPVETRDLLDELPSWTYSQLSTLDCIAVGRAQTWRAPSDTVVVPDGAADSLYPPLLADEFPVPHPRLPQQVIQGFCACKQPLPRLTPQRLRDELRVKEDCEFDLSSPPRECLGTREWVLALLKHCVSDRKHDDLNGVPLGLLASGRIRSFSSTRKQKIFLANTTEREIFLSEQHWFIDAEAQRECGLEASAGAGLQDFTPQLAVLNLKNVLPSVNEDSFVDPGTCENAPSSEWLTMVYRYLVENKDHVQLKPDVIKSLPLVPDQFGMLRGMGLASTPLLASADDQRRLGTALKYFNVPVVFGDSDLMSAIRAFVDAYPDDAIWRVHPRDLIDTLEAIAGPQSSDDEQVCFRQDRHGVVLDYLASSRNTKELNGKASDRIDKLRGLRLFPSAKGDAVRLDATDYYVPQNFDLPRIETDIRILESGPEKQWNPLYSILRVPTLTRARLVEDLFLPKLAELSKEEINRFTQWLRQNLPVIRDKEACDAAEKLVARLGTELPVMCTDGIQRTTDNLYHPDANFVGTLLGTKVGFPDLAVYSERTELWIEFFTTLGMKMTPRANDVISAIDHLLLNDTIDFSERVKRINDITQYLEKHWDEIRDDDIQNDDLRPDDVGSWHLCDALSHRKWIPALQTPPRGVPLALLAKPSLQFYQPENLFARSAVNLVSSVKPICALDSMPKLGSSVGLRSEPEWDDVVDQLINICDRCELSDDGTMSKRVGGMLKSIHRYIGRSMLEHSLEELEHLDAVQSLRKRVHNYPCILDESLRPWYPIQCFLEPVPHLLGRGVQVRSEERDVDRGLLILGRRSKPDVDDFRALFKYLALTPIAPDDLTRVRQAYQKAANISSQSQLKDTPVLSEDGTLVQSGDMVLDDAPWFSERIRSASVSTLDSELGRVAIAFDVRRLSVSVYEKRLRESPSNNAVFLAKCGKMEERLRSPELVRGVERLLTAAGTAVRRKQLIQFFQDLRVDGVAELETTLVWSDEDMPIEGSAALSDLLFDHDHDRNTIVVSEDCEEVFVERIADVINRELQLDDNSLGEKIANFVSMLGVPPERIEGHLTKLHVPMLPDEAVTVDAVADDQGGLIDEAVVDEGEPRESQDQEESDDGVASSQEADHDVPSTESASGGDMSQPSTSVDVGQDEAECELDSDTQSSELEQDRSASKVSQDDDAGVDADEEGRDSGNGQTGHSSKTEEKKTTGTHARGRRRRRTSGDGKRDATAESGPSRRKSSSGSPGWIAVTRVKSKADESTEESPEKQLRRRQVDQAAVKRVLAFERERGRRPEEMEHENEGYDIESFGPTEQIERYIEVKGLSGAWTNFGVSISRAQHRKAIREKTGFWLYVVEFALEPDRSRVFAIQDPAELIDQYWFDDGWKLLSKEQTGPSTDARPREGASVVVDGTKHGRIKKIKSHGILQYLQIEFIDGEIESLVYTPRRIEVVPDAEGE